MGGRGARQVHPGASCATLLGDWHALSSIDTDRATVRTLVTWSLGPTTVTAATVPLDRGWTLETEGSLSCDGGQTAIRGGSMGFGWSGADAPGPEERARLERVERARSASAAATPRRRLVRVRHAEVEVVLLDEMASDARGSAHVMWPPVAAPEGLLVRRARLADTGSHSEHEALDPWFVATDGTVSTWPVDGEPLGVSPLCGLPSGGWLMPTHDLLWLDGSDGHLCVVRPGGLVTPWTVGGEPVRPSRVLAELVPDVLAGVVRRDPGWSDPWRFTAARADEREGRLLVALEVRWAGRLTAMGVSAPLDGTGALRLDCRFDVDEHAGLALVP